jgi:hypothetical protein
MRRFFLIMLVVVGLLTSCNDGPKPRRIKTKQNSDAVVQPVDPVPAWLAAKMSWVDAPLNAYRDQIVDHHLGVNTSDDGGKMTVVLDFVGVKQKGGDDVAALLEGSACAGMAGTASKFSADGQQDVLTRLSSAYSDLSFVLNDVPAATKERYIIVTIGGTAVDAGCPATAGAGVALINYGSLIPRHRVMVFDPPAETTETVERLVHHVEQIVLVGSGELDLADDFGDYSGGEVLEPISGEVSTLLLGLGRGVDALKPNQVANVAALEPQLTDLLTKRTVPLAGIDRAITVVAFASSATADDKKINIADVADILGKAANSPAADTLSVIATAAGHPEIALGLEVVKLILGDKGATSTPSANPTPMSLPRFDELLQIKTATDAESAVALVEKYRQLKDHLDSHYSGGSQTALRAATLVGFAQALSGN